MAKRFAHKILPWGPGTNPGIILCVQGAVRQQYQSDADAWGYQALESWAGCPMVRTDDGYRTGATVTGDSVEQFWQWVISEMDAHGTTVVVSMCAREQCSILGLWDMMLEKSAGIGGKDPWDRKESQGCNAQESRGFVILESPPTIVDFTLSAHTNRLVWVDPANYGADDLWAHCKDANGICGPAFATNNEAWQSTDTLQLQVECVNDWMDSYVQAITAIGIGALEQTAATQAMAGYRRKYLTHPITVHDSLATLKLERAGLYGGRNECRYIGEVYGNGSFPTHTMLDGTVPNWIAHESPVYHLDVNSLYAAVAVNANLPCKLISSSAKMSASQVIAAAAKMPCVSECYVDTDVPCVPLRLKTGIIYPIGKFWTTLCAPEISLVASLGKILAIKSFAAYQGAPIYHDWITDIYSARLRAEDDGLPAMASCYKRLLTASFGKWAQMTRRWVAMPDELCDSPFSQWWEVNEETDEAEQWRSFAWAVERCHVVGEPSESMPIITATIHSLARVRLWELLQTAGPENVYYYDTDSLWCNQRALDRLRLHSEIHQRDLGKMRIVAEHSVVQFMGQKRYKADGKLTVSGANLGSVATGDAFATVLRARSLDNYLTHDSEPGTDRQAARVRINLPYVAGRVGPDGWTFPFSALDLPAE